VREEIRLGNEALARHDLETAKQYFQQVLATDATEVQKRIAANRLREIEEGQQQAEEPSTPAPRQPRTRRKTSAVRSPAESSARRFVRPPDNPVIVINRH
jgi:hypothetical protein